MSQEYCILNLLNIEDKNVKLIVIDMYSPYISLIKKMLPNAEIIINKFHLVNLTSTSLNKTRINIMKKDKKI